MLLTSVDFLHVGQLSEGMSVTERNVDHSVVSKGGKSVHNSGFLSSSESSGRHEHTGVFASKGAARPELTCSIPEGLDK